MSEQPTAPGQRPRLLLLDGHSLAYRAFFALPVENFSTTTGQPTNAVYGFTSMLINVLRDEQPTHLGVAFDVSRQTFRSEEYADYKANRSASPDEFKGQVSLVKEVLAALRIPTIEKDGYEADDVIATLTTQAVAEGFEVLVCTGDRDALQLVSDSCTILYPRKGVSDLARMTPEAVEEKYGVPPHRYPEIAALVGESSDNLPGVPGVGPKTAAKWISQYDGLENVIAHADQIKGKAGDSLREHLGEVIRNRRLNALVCDLELTARPTDLAMQPWDRQEVHKLFDGLEFRVLRDRLFATLESAEEIEEGGFELDGTRLGQGEVEGWLKKHARVADARVGVQVQGTWRAGTGDVYALALATGDGSAAWLDAEQLTPEDDRALADWLADPSYRKVLHDAKGPMLALSARGWSLAGLERDTALSAYLARPDQRSYDLADLTLRYLKRELRQEDADQGQLSFDSLGEDSSGDTSMLQARAILDLAEALDDELESRGGTRLLAEVELPLVDVLADLERTGVAVDTEHLQSLESHFAGEVKKAADEAYDVIGKEINLGSPEAAPGGAVRRAGHAEDQAHQDRLHHRRRRAAAALREDRAPVPARPAAAPRRLAAAADRGGPAQDGAVRRPDPHHVQPDDRGDRAALQHRPEPAEHPDPHRGGPPDPGGVRRRRGLRVADDRRLQPDRDADHGAPVGGRPA